MPLEKSQKNKSQKKALPEKGFGKKYIIRTIPHDTV